MENRRQLPMDEPIRIASVICPHCGVTVDATVDRCATCGTVTHSQPTSAHVVKSFAPGLPGDRSVIDNRTHLLLLLFGAALFLGLPLLWVSRAYGLVGKLVITVLVLLWSALLLSLFWWSFTWSWSRIQQAL